MADRSAIVVGAGLSGLACARRLVGGGCHVTLLEAAAEIGGRVRTDEVEGFLLDRGFQVLLTAYPEAHAQLDLERLDLQHFHAGALVRKDGDFVRLSDPRRHPGEAFQTLTAPLTTARDKVRLVKLLARLQVRGPRALFEAPEQPTRRLLEREFSPPMVEGFLRPFLAGIFLESNLDTSSRMFEFVFKMFASGRAAVPGSGMQAIPRQLAEAIPPQALRTGLAVEAIEAGAPVRVRIVDGRELTADAVVVATDQSESQRLTGAGGSEWNGTTCIYFSAPDPPVEDAILVLNGEARGPINNLCAMSQVAPRYAPGDEHLISVTVLGAGHDEARILEEVRLQLGEWFGDDVRAWRHLRTYSIPNALPRFEPETMSYEPAEVCVGDGVFVCGDHRANPSIEAALRSGRVAAEAVLEAF